MKTDRPRKIESRNQIYKTICDTCHQACEVPFKPNGLKPVFCDACFKHTKDTGPGEYVRRKDKTIYDAPDNFVQPINPLTSSYAPSAEVKMAELKRELASANAKLDKLIDMFTKKIK